MSSDVDMCAKLRSEPRTCLEMPRAQFSDMLPKTPRRTDREDSSCSRTSDSTGGGMFVRARGSVCLKPCTAAYLLVEDDEVGELEGLRPLELVPPVPPSLLDHQLQEDATVLVRPGQTHVPQHLQQHTRRRPHTFLSISIAIGNQPHGDLTCTALSLQSSNSLSWMLSVRIDSSTRCTSVVSLCEKPVKRRL